MPSDRGSIQFLLNSGSESFMKSLHFPSSNSRTNFPDYRASQNSSFDSKILVFDESEHGSMFSDISEDAIDWSIFQDENLQRFLTGPNSEQLILEDRFFARDNAFESTSSLIAIDKTIDEWDEPPSLQLSAAMVQAVLGPASQLSLSPQERNDLLQNITYLFRPSRIQRLVAKYLQTWHSNFSTLHMPSFVVDSTPIPLLISIVFMGAMYSQVEREVRTARILVDLAELSVFSISDLREEFEINDMFRSSHSSTNQDTVPSAYALQSLQAAKLMVCIQYWSGTPVAKKRAVESRFGVVVKACLLLFTLYKKLNPYTVSTSAGTYEHKTWNRR